MNYAIIIGLWLLALAAAYPYVKRVRNPDQHLLAAYMIFITIFGAASFFLFALLTRLAAMMWPEALGQPGPLLLLAVVSLVPAFYLARWQIRKPGMQRPPPP